MAIAGFKKVDATYYTSRCGAYALVKLGKGWAAFTEAESKDDMEQLSEPGTQAQAVQATKDHAARPAPAEPTPAAPAPCEPTPCAAEAEPQAETKPKAPRRRSRVDVTQAAMEREQGVTVSELVALFDAEFGAGTGKRSTASQAVFKVPAARKFAVAKSKEEGRDGIVYRRAPAP